MMVFKLSQIGILPLLQKVSVQNYHEVARHVHFSPHDKVHLEVFEHLVLIGNGHLLVIPFKLTFELGHRRSKDFIVLEVKVIEIIL